MMNGMGFGAQGQQSSQELLASCVVPFKPKSRTVPSLWAPFVEPPSASPTSRLAGHKELLGIPGGHLLHAPWATESYLRKHEV